MFIIDVFVLLKLIFDFHSGTYLERVGGQITCMLMLCMMQLAKYTYDSKLRCHPDRGLGTL